MRIRYLSLVVSVLITSSVVMTQATPSSTVGYYNRGGTGMEKNDWDGTKADFNKAVELASVQDNRPEFVIAVLGDSYASGEGAPDVHGNHSRLGDLVAVECFPNPFDLESPTCYSETWWSPDSWFSNRLAVFPQQDDPGWQDDARRCHRSSKGPAAHAAMIIAARFPDVKITVLDFACGGAKITDGLLIGYSGAEPDIGATNISSQVEALEAYVKKTSRSVDAIVMNIGGNDAEFAAIITKCIILDPGLDCQADPLLNKVGELVKDRTTPEFPDKDAPLRARYSVVDAVFRNTSRADRKGVPGLVRARPAEVYLTGPPNPSHDAPPVDSPASNPSDLCDGTQTNDPHYDKVKLGEAFAMENLVGGNTNSMRAAMRLAADRHGWIFIDMFDLSRDHGVCADNKSFFRTNDDALRIQGDEGLLFFPFNIPIPTGYISPGIAHQNEAGYAARANQIADVVEEQVRMKFRAPTLYLDQIEAGTATKVSFKWNDPSPRQPPETRWELEIAKRGTLNRGHLYSDGSPEVIGEFNVIQPPAGPAFSWRISESGEFTARVRGCRATPTGFYCGPFSNAVTVVTFIPGTPVGLESFGLTHPSAIGARWTPGPRTPISVRYEVTYGPYGGMPCSPPLPPNSTCGSSMFIVNIRSTTRTTYVLGARLLPAPTYWFRVRACSTAGCSPYTPQLILP
jgi:hypothetical protein